MFLLGPSGWLVCRSGKYLLSVMGRMSTLVPEECKADGSEDMLVSGNGPLSPLALR